MEQKLIKNNNTQWNITLLRQKFQTIYKRKTILKIKRKNKIQKRIHVQNERQTDAHDKWTEFIKLNQY